MQVFNLLSEILHFSIKDKSTTIIIRAYRRSCDDSLSIQNGRLSEPPILHYCYCIYELLAGAIGFAGGNQCGLEISGLGRVSLEQADGGADRGRPGRSSNHTVHQAADHNIAGPVLGSILRVFAEECLIAVGAGADGALERVEGFLTGLGSGNGQPGQGGIRVLGADGQHEAVGQEVEDAIGARGGGPVEVSVGLQGETIGGCVGKVAISPVAHDVEGGIAIGIILEAVCQSDRVEASGLV